MLDDKSLVNEDVVIDKKVKLIDQAIEIDKRMKNDKKKLDEIKSELQAEGLGEMENKNLKYVQYFSEDGSVDLSYRQKLEVDNISLLKEIFGENLESKITRKEDIKYDVESKFKGALIALYTGDYRKHDVVAILQRLSLDDKKVKLAVKKLKGDYIADKKLLESLGAVDSDGLEEELDAIRENINYNTVSKYLNIDDIDDELLGKIKRAISVDETLSLGLNYEKE